MVEPIEGFVPLTITDGIPRSTILKTLTDFSSGAEIWMNISRDEQRSGFMKGKRPDKQCVED